VAIGTYVNERDTQGPVVSQAVFYLGNPPGYTGEPHDDTLIITFNEPVTAADIQALISTFLYVDDGVSGQQGTVLAGATFDLAPGETVTQITIYFDPSQSGHVTPNVDSVGFIPGAVTDVWGNPSPSVPGVVVEWGRDYDVVISVFTNPFVPGKSPIAIADLGLTPEAVSLHNGEPPSDATVIRVSSATEMDPDPGRSKMAVYDALGNVIEDEVPLYTAMPVGNSHQAYFFWDARNRNERLVGSGTYLAVMQVGKVEGDTKVTRQKLGVMR
jgi:hypothetical protein